MLLEHHINQLKKAQLLSGKSLSTIPPMASAISKRIAKFRQDYSKQVGMAKTFFAEYQEQLTAKAKYKKAIKAYQEQIDLIENYRKEKGKYPKIKNQPSTERYLRKLYHFYDKALNDFRAFERKILVLQAERYQNLDHLVDQILDLLDGQRIFSQFLGTIALSVPSPEEKVRHVRNEKNKPIFITALAIALFEEIRTKHNAEQIHPYLAKKLQEIFPPENPFNLMVDKHEEEQKPNVMPIEIKIAYREEILKPLAKACLLQSIGTYSPEVEALFGNDRYRMLSPDERESLLKLNREKTADFIKIGIGIPATRFDTKEARAEFIQTEAEKVQFILDIQSKLSQIQDPLGDLLRIPMVYTSIILSTKPEFDYKQIYTAFDTLEQGAQDNIYHPEYIHLFNCMVGRFPLGSGIYFIQQETGEIERGIVSSLYPQNPDEPICKQITRRQLQFLCQTEVVISSPSNLYFEISRANCHYESDYFKTRFPNGFIWNASELWEVQVPAVNFWKKDGTIKYNELFKPLDYDTSE
ncbi:hypothetical protein N7931_18405 [Catenovulum sp. 2E275]|uniref:hypothetical protein n=1 Tax=Catenovulum sp. 2E275 TaxID=2980497 RepID=UPI0021D3BE46|nr:hypothetical protein [Catenovulum sp. 2E275]MCU4677594.1 hypothetical protein [Catenovulum sp. 2E275]